MELTFLGFMQPFKLNLVEVGLNPATPVKQAGILMLPATSDATANGTHPMATSAASPPDEPPGVRDKSHGFLDRPHMRLWDSLSIII
jgi:hypothetical protein